MTNAQINLKLLSAAVAYKQWLMNSNEENRCAVYHRIGDTKRYFKIEVDLSVEPEDLLKQIHELFIFFDVSKETMPFLDKNGHGIDGFPRSMKECYELIEGVRDEINHLHLIMHMVYYAEYYKVKKSA